MIEEIDYINESNHKYAVPLTREQLLNITDEKHINSLQVEADDIVISIQTQLEYLDDDDENLKRRRVNALIYWKIAQKNLKQRLTMLRMEKKKEENE